MHRKQLTQCLAHGKDPIQNGYYTVVCLFLSSFPHAQSLGNETTPWMSLGKMCAESPEEVLIKMESVVSLKLSFS